MKARADDRSYHEARALAEQMLAESCADPSIAKVHRKLAALHKRRMIEIVYLGEPQYDPRPLVGHRPLRPDLN